MGRSRKRWLLCAVCATALFYALPRSGMAYVPMEHVQDFVNVSGQVLSSQGGAVAGATIHYGEAETSADQNGRFAIQLDKPGNVVFSAIGHTSKTMLVTKDTVLTVMLETDGCRMV